MTKHEMSGLGSKARNAAVRELVRLHQAEFDRIHGDERERIGLPRELTGHHNSEWGGRKPCKGCGGPKDRNVHGARYCTTCHEARAERRREQVRANAVRQRAVKPLKPCRRCGGEKERGRPGSFFCVKCVNEMGVTQQTKKERVARIEKRPAKLRVVKSKPRVPKEVLAAWNAGDDNSIIRRKYPTKAALEKAYAA